MSSCTKGSFFFQAGVIEEKGVPVSLFPVLRLGTKAGTRNTANYLSPIIMISMIIAL